MSASGKAGNGRGNNRRRPFGNHSEKRKEKDSGVQQEGLRGERPPLKNDTSSRNGVSQKARGGAFSGEIPEESTEKRSGGRLPLNDNQGRRSHARGGFFRQGGENSRQEKAPYIERPKWIPPKINTEPLPVPVCPWCGRPIRDIAQAMTDKETGEPVHFDCVAARIAVGETLEKGDTVTYIGGGRFGIVSFGSSGGERSASGKWTDGISGKPQDQMQQAARQEARASSFQSHDFTIKKIIEWENKDKRAEWRSLISEHYSLT